MQASSRPGISRAELLVVLLVSSMLVGVLLPAVQGARQLNDQEQSINNLKQLALAVHNMHDAYGTMPPVVGSFPDRGQNSMGTIFHFMLPFVEQDNTYRNSYDGRGYYVWHNDSWGQTIKTFVAPGDTSAAADYRHENWLATSNYAANYQLFGSNPGGGVRLANITDGTSNTMMFAERYRKCGEHVCSWGYPTLYYWAPVYAYYSQGKFQATPTQKKCDAGLAQSLHARGIHVAMADGSTKTVADTVSPRTWWLVCTPSDGTVLDRDW